MNILAYSIAVFFFCIIFIGFFLIKKKDRVNLTETSSQIYLTFFTIIIFTSTSVICSIYSLFNVIMNYNLLLKGSAIDTSRLILLSFQTILMLYPLISCFLFIVNNRLNIIKTDQHLTIAPEEDKFIKEALAEACKEMGIKNVPDIIYSNEININPQIMPISVNKTIIVFPDKIIKILQSFSRRLKNSRFERAFLKYLIRHELAHIKNNDILVFYLLRSFSKSCLNFIALDVLLLAIAFIAKSDSPGFLLYMGPASIPLMATMIFYYIYLDVIERKREYFADTRAVYNANAQLISDLVKKVKTGNDELQPLELLIRGIISRTKTVRNITYIKNTTKIIGVVRLFFYYMTFSLRETLLYISKLIYPLKGSRERINNIINSMKSNQIDLTPSIDVAIWSGILVIIKFYFLNCSTISFFPYRFIHKGLSLPEVIMLRFGAVFPSEVIAFVSILFDCIIVLILLISLWNDILNTSFGKINYKKAISVFVSFILASFITLSLIYTALYVTHYYRDLSVFIIANYYIEYQYTHISLIVLLYIAAFILIRIYNEYGGTLSREVKFGFLSVLISFLLNLALVSLILDKAKIDHTIFGFIVYVFCVILYILFGRFFFDIGSVKNVLYVKLGNQFMQIDWLHRGITFLNMLTMLFTFVFFLCLFTLPLIIINSIDTKYFDLAASTLNMSYADLNSWGIRIIGITIALYVLLNRNLKPVGKLDFNYFSYQLLESLGIDAVKTANARTSSLIETLHSNSGGYYEYPLKSNLFSKKSMKSIWTYFKCFFLCNKIENPHFDKSYLINYENSKGGFGYVSNRHVRLEATMFALELINEMNSTNFNINLHRDWILSCYRKDGFFTEYPNNLPSIENAYFALSSLNLISALDKLPDANQIYNKLIELWINSKKNEECTYYFARSLAIINMLTPKIQSQITEDWMSVAKQRIVNTRFDKHYKLYYYFLKVQELLGIDDRDVKDIVKKELHKMGFIEENPETT